jgi:hypothetical protein
MPLRTLLQQTHSQSTSAFTVKIMRSKWSPTQPVLYCAKTCQGEGNIQHPVPIMNDRVQGKKRHREDDTGQMGY